MVKSAYGDIKPSAGKVAKSVSKNIGKGTFDSTINSVLDIKLNENVSTGKVFKQVGYMERYVEQCRFGVVLKRASNLAGIFTLLNAGVSIQDNIATYGFTAEAGGRIAIDAGALILGVAITPLLPATVMGFGLGVAAGTLIDYGAKTIKNKRYGDVIWD